MESCALAQDQAVHGATLCVLHGNGQVLAGQEAVLELHHMRVDEQRVVQDLPFHILGYLALRSAHPVDYSCVPQHSGSCLARLFRMQGWTFPLSETKEHLKTLYEFDGHLSRS